MQIKNPAGVAPAGVGPHAGAESARKADLGRTEGVQTWRVSDPAPADGDRDAVAISHLATALQELREASPEREARVAKLAAAVESGRYGVDAAAISRSLIDEALLGE